MFEITPLELALLLFVTFSSGLLAGYAVKR